MKKYNIISISCAIILTILSMIFTYNIGKSQARVIDKTNYNTEIKVITQYINVRECASKTCENIGRVTFGSTFIAKQKIDATATYDWYQIEYAEGEFGWIASDKLEPYVKENK